MIRCAPCLTDIFNVLWPCLSCVCLCVMSPMSVLVSVMDGCDRYFPRMHHAMIQEYEHIWKQITLSWISPLFTLKIHSTCMKSTRVKSSSERPKEGSWNLICGNIHMTSHLFPLFSSPLPITAKHSLTPSISVSVHPSLSILTALAKRPLSGPQQAGLFQQAMPTDSAN